MLWTSSFLSLEGFCKTIGAVSNGNIEEQQITVVFCHIVKQSYYLPGNKIDFERATMFMNVTTHSNNNVYYTRQYRNYSVQRVSLVFH